MSMELNLSWLDCIDEIMVDFRNAHTPGWITLIRKPHPLGNECHTVACGETKLVFSMELFERKDKPKEGTCTAPEFEEVMRSKIIELYLHMTKTRVSGQGCELDSVFGHTATVA